MRVRPNNVSDRQGTNFASIPSGGGSTTATFQTAPALPTIASPDYAVLVWEPNTANEEITYITAYTSGATTATIERGASPIAHTLVHWNVGPTGDDYRNVYDDLPAFDSVLSYEFNALNTTSVPSGWAWLNQGDATYYEDNGSGTLYNPNSGSSSPDDVSAIIQPITFSYPFTVWASVSLGLGLGNYCSAGIVMYASGSGQLTAFALGTGPTFFTYGWSQWTDPTTFSSSGGQPTPGPLPNFRYWRVIFTSESDWELDLSDNGYAWWQVVTGYDPSGFETGFDHLGFFADANGGGDSYCSLQWMRFEAS